VRIGETPQTQLIAQTAPPLRPTRTLRAVSVTEPVPGRFVFDFGQNMPGWVKLRATGPAGSCITLRFAELLNADGTADQSNLRRAECTDRCILRGEVGGDAAGESFAPRFTYHGFRYVEVEGYPGTPTADDIEAVIVHSDCRETGDMTFASPLLQRIWTNALWSQRSNFFAVPTDCPQRDERMGWMGDIQVFLGGAAARRRLSHSRARAAVLPRRGDRGLERGGHHPAAWPVATLWRHRRHRRKLGGDGGMDGLSRAGQSRPYLAQRPGAGPGRLAVGRRDPAR
jgi:hypothetical protein